MTNPDQSARSVAGFYAWLASPLQRVFPLTDAGACGHIDVPAVRNGRAAFQVCLRNTLDREARIRAIVTGAEDLRPLVREVGLVPMAHHTTATEIGELDGVGCIPGFVPDPLLPTDTLVAGPHESRSFWISLFVSAEMKPGPRQLRIRLSEGDDTRAELAATVNVGTRVLQPRTNFPVTHWFYADALCDWYGLAPWEEKLWRMVGLYIRNLVEHGNDCVYVPLFTPPTDGVKRPTQLLRVSGDAASGYSFDFADVRRWAGIARDAGATSFEWTHLFTQWGAANAIRIYRDNADAQSLLWPPETPATSETYRAFLSSFLPAFREFLDAEDLLDKSLFHVSDEPDREDWWANYRAARALVREIAPWMKTSDAMSNPAYAAERLIDIPIPSVHSCLEFRKVGLDPMAYFCCGPRGAYLNRFLDTPLAKIAMAGPLLYRHRLRGFLHWGGNYWYKQHTTRLIDPYRDQSADNWPGIPAGDPFVVYPGEDGPVDSIRWEVFADSLQDYALLQTAGIDPDDALLAPLNSFCDFPKDGSWLAAMRAKLSEC